MLTLILLQTATAVSAEARERYQPYRQCLVEHARALARIDKPEEAILGQARSECMAANLAAGSAALFAERKVTASQSEAIDHVAALRVEVEQEALAAIRTAKANGSK